MLCFLFVNYILIYTEKNITHVIIEQLMLYQCTYMGNSHLFFFLCLVPWKRNTQWCTYKKQGIKKKIESRTRKATQSPVDLVDLWLVYCNCTHIYWKLAIFRVIWQVLRRQWLLGHALCTLIPKNFMRKQIFL